MSMTASTGPSLRPWEVYQSTLDLSMEVPDIIEFTVSDRYLNRPNLYPRQGTLLKVITGQVECFCADRETEILTRRGWKHYWELVGGEDVLTLDHETGLAEWARMDGIHVFPVEGEDLIRMRGKAHSSLTTPNHRWPSEHSYYRERGTKRVRENKFVETKDLSGNSDRIACAARVANLPQQPTWSDAFVELVAWYWTEGHAITGYGGARISQSARVNESYVDRIRGCLTALFGPATRWMEHELNLHLTDPSWFESKNPRGMVEFRLNRSAAADLRWVAEGDEKVVQPWFISSLTQEQLDLFIDVSMWADGFQDDGGHRVITQASKGRLESLQMACSLAGIRSVLREGTVGYGRWADHPRHTLSLWEGKRFFSPQKRSTFTIESETYTGEVWCPTTRNKTWLARRDGTVYFTGNTSYDEDVLSEWITLFERTGEYGISPDIAERLAWMRADGRKWFAEVVAVIGRRGSKGYVGAVMGAYVTWNFLCLGDPQGHYGVDRDKQLAGYVFAGKKDQAKTNQWRDIYNTMVSGASCFSPYISRAQSETLTLYAPHDLERMLARYEAGVTTTIDEATFTIIPKETVPLAARGPASYMHFWDEMAFIIPQGPIRSAAEVYRAAKPSLQQFGKDQFVYCQSSPWEMAGQFYENWKTAFARTDDDTGPAVPMNFMVQLPSPALYEDWERSEDLGYSRKVGPMIDLESPDLILDRKKNPENFAVEYLAHWATVLDAYLNPAQIDQIWNPWPNNARQLLNHKQGKLNIHYRMHGDPSSVNAGFGFAVAHMEPPLAEGGLPHVVFDYVHVWEPTDFEDGIVDYETVFWDIAGLMDGFVPEHVSFDQFNSVGMIQRLSKYARAQNYHRQTTVFERTATEPVNWRTYENFKAAVNLGLVHAPFHSKADLELRYLKLVGPRKVDKPSLGPVQTKDIADCLAVLVNSFLGELLDPGMSDFNPKGAMAGGLPTYPQGTDAVPSMPDSPFAGFSKALARSGRMGSIGGGMPGRPPIRRR